MTRQKDLEVTFEDRLAYAEQMARAEVREGIEERVALDMLRKQADVDFILEISKLSFEELEVLAKQHDLTINY